MPPRFSSGPPRAHEDKKQRRNDIAHNQEWRNLMPEIRARRSVQRRPRSCARVHAAQAVRIQRQPLLRPALGPSRKGGRNFMARSNPHSLSRRWRQSHDLSFPRPPPHITRCADARTQSPPPWRTLPRLGRRHSDKSRTKEKIAKRSTEDYFLSFHIVIRHKFALRLSPKQPDFPVVFLSTRQEEGDLPI